VIHKCHDTAILHMDVSADGKFYATGCDDGTVSLWNRHDGAGVATYANHTDKVTEIHFSPKNDMFASSSVDGTMCVYSLQSTAKAMHVLKRSHAVYDVEFVRNGELFVSADHAEIIHVWNYRTGKLVQELTGHSGTTKQLEGSDPKHLLASLDTNGKTILWNTQDWKTIRSLPAAPTSAPLLTISGNGKSLVIRDAKSHGDLALWNVASGVKKKTWTNQEGSAYVICADPIGQFVVAANRSARIYVRDFAVPVDRFSLPSGPLRPKAELSQDGTRLVLVRPGIDLHAWDLNTHSIHQVRATRAGMVCVDVSADGHELTTAGATWRPAVFNIESGKLLSHPSRAHKNLVHAVTYSHDGSMIAGASDRHLWIWDRKTMQGTDVDCSKFQRIRSLAFSPDDQTTDVVFMVDVAFSDDAFDGLAARTVTVTTTDDGADSLRGNVDGDDDFDSNDTFLMHLALLAGTDEQINQSKGSSPLTPAEIRAGISQLGIVLDVDGDRNFDANDSFLIHLVRLAGTDAQIDQSKGNSPLTASQIRANVASLGDGSGGRRQAARVRWQFSGPTACGVYCIGSIVRSVCID
jgi:WD40 repeat protein